MDEKEYRERITKYSLDELKECLSGLDAERYPERRILLEQAVIDRGNEIDANHPSKGSDTSDPIYAGFWRRLAAYLIDTVIMAPLVVASIFLGAEYLHYHVYMFIPGIALGIFFHVYLVERYGGTPGKRIMRIKIRLLDGTDVTRQAAIYRFLPLFVLTTLSSLAFVISCLLTNNEVYSSLDMMKKNQLLIANAPSWYEFTNYALQIWVWSEFLTMLFNKRRRSIHDFIAGTIVTEDPTGIAST